MPGIILAEYNLEQMTGPFDWRFCRISVLLLFLVSVLVMCHLMFVHLLFSLWFRLLSGHLLRKSCSFRCFLCILTYLLLFPLLLLTYSLQNED